MIRSDELTRKILSQSKRSNKNVLLPVMEHSIWFYRQNNHNSKVNDVKLKPNKSKLEHQLVHSICHSSYELRSWESWQFQSCVPVGVMG